MNISQISEKMSNFITKDLDYSEEKKEVVTYAIETGFLSLLGFTVILIGGYFFDALIPAAIAAVFGGLLRRVSGGAHFNTPIKCLAFGAIIYT
ncbi:MAG: accessory gene regulator B family protein, partial [Eubacteriales bacterium]